MTDNVIEFGKQKKPEPSKPVDGDLSAYAASRRIAKHLGIAVSTEDAVKLELQLQSMLNNAYLNGILNEREACAKVCDDWESDEAFVSNIAEAIRARGKQ